MKFKELPIGGAFHIGLEKIYDHRGFFSRSFCKEKFQSEGLETNFEQNSLSFSRYKRTLRGLHYQMFPLEEIKIITCLQGAIYDVILDLRPDSKTFLQWYSIELNGNEENSLYIPKGCAHGFQTLEDNTKVHYQISQPFVSSAYRCVRWNDPQFEIKWPYNDNLIISEKDHNQPDYVYEKSTCNRF